MDVAVHCEQVAAGFSRYHKYTLGTDLRNKSRQVLSLIVKANSAKEKLPHLMELRGHLEDLLILTRLCKEVKAFKSFNAYVFVAEEVASLSRQNEGWIKSVAA
jgi:hypothetical protein